MRRRALKQICAHLIIGEYQASGQGWLRTYGYLRRTFFFFQFPCGWGWGWGWGSPLALPNERQIKLTRGIKGDESNRIGYESWESLELRSCMKYESMKPQT